MTARRRAPTQAHQAGATGNLRRKDALPPASTPTVPTFPALIFQPSPALTPVYRISETMARVAATAPDHNVPGFPGIFALLEEGAHTTPRLRLERLTTLPLGDRSPLVVCLKAPDPHIRVLWGAQSATPSFANPTPEEKKILAFARDIRLGLLLVTVVVNPECLTPGEVTVS